MSQDLETLSLLHKIETAAIESCDVAVDEIILSLERAEGVDLTASLLERVEHSAEHYKAKAKQYSAIHKALEATSAKMRAFIKDAALAKDDMLLEGVETYFRVSRAKSKLEIDESLLPKEFLRPVTEYVADKALIESELNLGNEIPGAKFVESFSLRSYVKRKVA